MDNLIGSRIRELRSNAGLTPKIITEYTGIGSGHLSQLETGKKLPSTPTLIKLSELFNCSVDWILFGKAHYSKSSDITKDETDLINKYRRLALDDKYEINCIVDMKLSRYKEKKKSSPSAQEDIVETA